MDTDSFWQQLDSENLLKRHGPELAAKAREAMSSAPSARFAGMITTADSRDAEALRGALGQASGRTLPSTLMVGPLPRLAIEALLTQYVEDRHWKDEPWQPQQVLPVVVATRDGYRFGFFRLDAAADGASHSP
jgi:hypothetical protein